MNTYECCPISGDTVQTYNGNNPCGFIVNSPSAKGNYHISQLALETLGSCDQATKNRLLKWIQNQRSEGVECPRIDEVMVARCRDLSR